MESEGKQTKRGGTCLNLTFQIVEGEFINRKMWASLNLVNQNDQAMAIAASELKAICMVLGIHSNPRNSQELHGRPLLVDVKIEAEKDESGKPKADNSMRNRITAYRRLDGTAPTQQPLGPVANPTAPPQQFQQPPMQPASAQYQQPMAPVAAQPAIPLQVPQFQQPAAATPGQPIRW